ncbi:MAG: O-antigen ligase family protein [candidate division Zixibacteria bacterium]|nr:O-antigen ligase family protein [candidate division Zixibacteria bacterium]
MKPEEICNKLAWLGLGGYALFSPISIAASQIMLGLTVAGFLGYLLTSKDKNRLVFPPVGIIIIILAYIGYKFATMIIGSNSLIIIKEEWLFLMALIGAIMFQDIKKLTIILDLFVIGVLLVGGYGIWQHFVGVDLYHQVLLDKMTYGYRSIGTFSVYLTFSGFFALAAIFLIPVGFAVASKFRKIAYLLASQVALTCIFFNYSRSTIVALIIGIVLLIALLPNQYRKWAIPVVLLTLVVALVVSPDFLHRFKNMDKTEFSSVYANSRFAIWGTALSMIEEEPLVGVGPGNFAQKYLELRANQTGKKLSHAHNDILNVAAESGIICAVLFVLMWAVILWRLYKGYMKCPDGFQKGLIFGSLLASVVFLGMSQFESFFADEEVRLLLMFFWGIGLAVLANMKASERLSEIA